LPAAASRPATSRSGTERLSGSVALGAAFAPGCYAEELVPMAVPRRSSHWLRCQRTSTDPPRRGPQRGWLATGRADDDRPEARPVRPVRPVRPTWVPSCSAPLTSRLPLARPVQQAGASVRPIEVPYSGKRLMSCGRRWPPDAISLVYVYAADDHTVVQARRAVGIDIDDCQPRIVTVQLSRLTISVHVNARTRARVRRNNERDSYRKLSASAGMPSQKFRDHAQACSGRRDWAVLSCWTSGRTR
jgi:hypothetical protein